MTDEAPPAGRAGRVALVLGVVGVVAALVPVLSYLAWAVGVAAFVVAIVALARPLATRGPAIAGLVLGIAAVILSIVASVVYTLLLVVAIVTPQLRGLSPSGPAAPGPSAGNGRIVLRVVGGGAADVDWSLSSGATALQDSASPVDLPWRHEEDLGGGPVDFSLTAQRVSGTARLTCVVTDDGVEVSRVTASAGADSVVCRGSAG